MRSQEWPPSPAFLKTAYQAAGCQSPLLLGSDLNFFDSMKGFDCVEGELRVHFAFYERDASPAQAMQLWDGALSDDYMVVWDGHWFAASDPGTLREIARALGSEAEPTDVVPPAQSLTLYQQDVNFCLGFVAGAVEQTVLGPPEGKPNLLGLNSLYAGIEEYIQELVAQNLGKYDESDTGRSRLWADLSNRADPSVVEFCESASERTD